MNNKGFTLVELMVVVAIMVVVSSVSIIGFNMISGKAASQCAKELQSSIQLNRINAMGKNSAKLIIEEDTNGIFVSEIVNGATVSRKKAGNSGVHVTYSYTDTNDYADIPAGGLEISFVRSSGSLDNVSSSDLYLKSSKGDKDFKVHIYHLTGKVVVE